MLSAHTGGGAKTRCLENVGQQDRQQATLGALRELGAFFTTALVHLVSPHFTGTETEAQGGTH